MNDLKCFVLALSVIILSLLPLMKAHVSLTFPPARKYDLDFLDNSRTKGPCGMPKGTIRTSFLAGATTNVTWHLAYPHRGGFRLQLLDHLERPVLDLTPSVGGTDFVRTDATAQHFEVRFPSDFTCTDCTLRLLRQADEWSNGYRFWSCADIDIKNRKEFRETCSGHGKYIGSRCKCDKKHYGSRCQYSDECTNDEDCGAQGNCIDLHGTSLPRRQCYCNFGWFGSGCSKKSPIKSKDLDLSLYSTKQLSSDYRIHWRILKEKNEIEIIAIVNGTSWVGLGWRPRQLNSTCRNFPLIQRDETSQKLIKPTSAGKENIPSTEPEPEGHATPEKEPNSEPEPEGHSSPEKEPVAENTKSSEVDLTNGKTHNQPEKEPSSEPIAENETPSSEPEGEPNATAEPSTEPTTTTHNPTIRPQPFRSRIYNKTKRLTQNVPLRERFNPQFSGGNLSKRQIRKRSTPDAEPEPNVTSEPEPEGASSNPKPEGESSNPEPEGASSNPEPEGASSNPEPEGASSNPEPEGASSNPEPEGASSNPEPEGASSNPEPEGASSNPEPEGASSNPEPEGASISPEPERAVSNPEPEGEKEPSAEEHPEEPSAEYHPTAEYTAHEYAPKHDFNPMDCTDIIIGTARNQTSRIMDYYTRDRSTPRQDSFWGGSNDLTATGGFEENGVTTIIFRRKLETKDPADHSILNDLMHVIWARGQEPGQYIHSPPSGLEKEAASMKNFYQPDELKYHGHKTQRGVTQINFFDETKAKSAKSNAATMENANINVLDNDCEGNWKLPRTCKPDKFDCEYYATWKTIGRGDEFRFHIQTTNTKTWTGIGFSTDEHMSQTDAVIGWVDPNGRPFLMDTWIVGYSAPKPDDQQNIYNVSGRIQNGATILEFTRKRETNDKFDLSFTEDQCLYLMFPVLGGRFNAVNYKMKKHEQTPIVTDTRICIKSCGRETLDNSVLPVDNVPSQLAYAVSVKLMNLAESFESPAKGTPEFESLASQIANSMAGVLGHISGYHDTEVNSFEKDDNAVIAKMNVLFDKDAYEKGRTVKIDPNAQNNELREADPSMDDGKIVEDTIRNSIQSAKLGALTVDPGYLYFRTLERNIEDADEAKAFFNLSEIRLYTVIGLIAALVFVALLQATCTIYKTSSSSRNQKDKLIPNSAWKDYSANTNYAFDTVDGHMSPDDKQQKRNGSRLNTSSSSQQTLPLSHGPMKPHYYNVDNGGRQQQMAPYENGNGYSRYGNDRTYSLPRQTAGASSHAQRFSHQPTYNEGYYTQDRRRNNSRSHHQPQPDESATTALDKPDFYFMPSQRKYSGEVVRVYVDYNKDMKN